MGEPVGIDAQGDLIGNGDAVAFEGNDFLWVVRENANAFEAEVNQDLCADATFVLHHALAGGLAIELAALMKMNLRQRAGLFRSVDGKPAAGVMEIEEHAATFLGDGFKRQRNELPAIAGGGTKHVAGEAVGMDAD